MEFQDTICAPASGAGGAVAMIRVSGPDALKNVDSIVTFRRGNATDSPGGRVKFGDIDSLDEVLVSIFRAPHSYTGEDSAEISCHASPYIVSGIVERLLASGCRMAAPGEFTRRAFANGKMDLAQAEAVADVIAAESSAQHRVAINQMKGGYSDGLREIRDRLLELSTLLELELDFSEEEVEFADREKLCNLATEAESRCRDLAASFRAGNAVKNGVPVAIIGAPNSGKSTLLNALLGDDRAIVSDIPGTTRDTVEETCVLEGIKFRFIDTAGLRETSDTVESLGIERSYAALGKAFVVLGVVDASGSSALEEADALRREFQERKGDGAQLIMVYNKIDALPAPVTDSAFTPGLMVSALKGDGMGSLRKALVEAAGPVDGSRTLVTNARHAGALRSASDSLGAVLTGLSEGLSGDLLAEDLRSAIASLNTILGEDLLTPQDTLNAIFKGFCIGK